MKNEDILEKLRLSGISLYDDISSADLFSSIDITIGSDYKSNFGFFHLHFNNVEAIMLKGVYKDFHRILSGEDDLHESDWGTIARTANDCEVAMQQPLNLNAILFGGVLYIKSASLNERKASTLFDRRDIRTPRPLTYAEYLINDSNEYLSDDTIISSGFINSYFPFVLSNLTLDIFKRASGILNPIFTSLNIKTVTPSVVDCNGSPYINLTGIERSLNFAKLDKTLFRLHFATPLYLKEDSRSRNVVSKLQLPYMNEEVNELVEELKRVSVGINISTLIEEQFFSYSAWIAIVYEYVAFMLIDKFSRLNTYAESFDSCLKLIYKSRKENFFTKAEGKKFVETFDISSDIVEYEFNNSFELKEFDEVVDEVGFKFGLFGKKKVVKLVDEIHELLNLKDEIFFITAKFVETCGIAVKKFAKNLKERGEINDINDIFFFDIGELKRLYNGTYFGSIRESLHFRRSAKERFNVSVTPSEIYIKDIEDRLEITEKIYSSNIEKRSIDLLSLFVEERESMVVTDDRLERYNGKVFAFSRVMPYMFARLKKADGFISESLPLFSLAVEFATLYDIPVYSGLRLAPLICKDRRVKLLKDRIEFI